jgi:AbrB family looped-hinge helix DNA binding protein
VASPQHKFEPMGSALISSQGQVTIPKPAREASGLTEGRVMVFVERKKGEVLLTHEPPADELIELAAETAKRKRAASPKTP